MSLPLPTPASVPTPADFTRVVRRYAHDARNHLNGLELSATLIEELAENDADIADAIGRIRRDLAQLEADMKSLILKFAEPRPGAVSAGDLLDLWKAGLETPQQAAQAIEWASPETRNAMLWLDRQAVAPALGGLTAEAGRRSGGLPLKVRIGIHSGSVIFELMEPATVPPPAADLIAESAEFLGRHGGGLERSQDPLTLEWSTRITFPQFPAAPGPAL